MGLIELGSYQGYVGPPAKRFWADCFDGSGNLRETFGDRLISGDLTYGLLGTNKTANLAIVGVLDWEPNSNTSRMILVSAELENGDTLRLWRGFLKNVTKGENDTSSVSLMGLHGLIEGGRYPSGSPFVIDENVISGINVGEYDPTLSVSEYWERAREGWRAGDWGVGADAVFLAGSALTLTGSSYALDSRATNISNQGYTEPAYTSEWVAWEGYQDDKEKTQGERIAWALRSGAREKPTLAPARLFKGKIEPAFYEQADSWVGTWNEYGVSLEDDPLSTTDPKRQRSVERVISRYKEPIGFDLGLGPSYGFYRKPGIKLYWQGDIYSNTSEFENLEYLKTIVLDIKNARVPPGEYELKLVMSAYVGADNPVLEDRKPRKNWFQFLETTTYRININLDKGAARYAFPIQPPSKYWKPGYVCRVYFDLFFEKIGASRSEYSQADVTFSSMQGYVKRKYLAAGPPGWIDGYALPFIEGPNYSYEYAGLFIPPRAVTGFADSVPRMATSTVRFSQETCSSSVQAGIPPLPIPKRPVDGVRKAVRY